MWQGDFALELSWRPWCLRLSLKGITPEADATFSGQLLIVRMYGRQRCLRGCFIVEYSTRCPLYVVYAVLGVCCTQCMLYLVYAVLGVCCTWCMLHLVYAVLGVCFTQCMLYSVYSVLSVSCTQCMVYSAYAILGVNFCSWNGDIERDDLTLCSAMMGEENANNKEHTSGSEKSQVWLAWLGV